MRKKAAFLVSIFAAFVLLAAGRLGYRYFWLNSGLRLREPQVVTVRKGAPLSAIANDLQHSGVIRSALVLRIYAELSARARLVKPGDYVFREAESIPTVTTHLVNGDTMVVTVTIPEGQTVHQIAHRLEREGLVCDYEFEREAKAGELIKALGMGMLGAEGYLYPATYRFSPHLGCNLILKKMLGRFFQQWTEAVERRCADLGMSVRQVVTLASIIEKEAKVAGERPLMAGVFYNRLQRHMPLQSDPTAQYNFEGAATPVVEAVHTQSPFNTYGFAGLPPGPIANPGWPSIEAVLYPTQTDYLYFVARNDGTHVFSRSLREHEMAIARVRNGSGRQAVSAAAAAVAHRNRHQ